MKRRRSIVAIVALGFLWSLVAWGSARALVVEKKLDYADSIVVLAGSTTYQERVRHAAQLLKEGRAPRIILTNDNQRGGWSEQKQTNPFFVEFAYEKLQSLGVRSDQIDMISPPAPGTYYEATELREYAQVHKLRSLLVVTSAYHSRRALWTFQRVFAGSGIELGVDPVPTGEQTPIPATWWLHVRGWKMVPVEYVKIVFYRVWY
jgi:uncharacterized SAM-binding protein YcdF (DUF218 family)